MSLDGDGGGDNEGCLAIRRCVCGGGRGGVFGSHSHEQGTSVMAAGEF